MGMRAGTIVAVRSDEVKLPPDMIARGGTAVVMRLENPVPMGASTTNAEVWLPIRDGGRTFQASGIVLEVACHTFAGILEADEHLWRSRDEGYELVLGDDIWATFIGADGLGGGLEDEIDLSKVDASDKEESGKDEILDISVACTKPKCRKWRSVNPELLEKATKDALPQKYMFTCTKLGRRCHGKCDECEQATCTCTCNECDSVGPGCTCPSDYK
jgi:hypothetical protein